MSEPDVYPDEMPSYPPLDERTLEAFLAGRIGAAAGLEPLAMLAGELETALSGPAPVPKPELALLLAEGFSTEKGDLPVTAASNVPGPATKQAAGLPKWRRKKMLVSEFLASLGLAAKLGLGVGVAAAAVGGAGAANVLPAPVQNAIATTVEAVTPFDFPDKADSHRDFGKTVASDATGASDGVPGVDGQAVADAAKGQGAANGGVGPNNGATGLERANQTPAAGHAPSSVPAPASGPPANPGSQGTTGLDRAADTPAAGKGPSSPPTPTSVPAGGGNAGSAGSPGAPGAKGLDTAGGTPAAGRAPTSAGRP